jgi:hypothetical protein
MMYFKEAFWMLAQILNEPKYSLHGRFLPGFPLLQQSFWVFEKLLAKSAPKLTKHLV